MAPGKILSERIPQLLPGYWRIEGWPRGFCFRHGPDREFYSALVVVSSAKSMVFEASVYCGVFPLWDGQFGRHHLRASTGLANLRVGSQAIDVRLVPYAHDGTPDGIERSVRCIADEAVKYAFPWFEKIRSAQESNPILKFGIEWVGRAESGVHAGTQQEIEAAFRAAGHVPWKVEHPVLSRLLHALRDFAAKNPVEKKDRDDIVILALDLLHHESRKRSG